MSLRVLELTYIDYISMLHCIQSYKFILEVTLKHKNTKKKHQYYPWNKILLLHKNNYELNKKNCILLE